MSKLPKLSSFYEATDMSKTGTFGRSAFVNMLLWNYNGIEYIYMNNKIIIVDKFIELD